MSDDPRSESREALSRPPKHPYEKPRLIDYGDIGTLTQMISGAPFSDGGLDPTMRTQSIL